MQKRLSSLIAKDESLSFRGTTFIDDINHPALSPVTEGTVPQGMRAVQG
jgi:hypothetical protein